MIKSISVTNPTVINALNEVDNVSKLIEVAVLYYLNEVDKTYIETYKAIQRANKVLKREREDNE